MHEKPPAKLLKLARLYGIQTYYRDPKGQRIGASTESLLAAVRALGGNTNGVEDVDAALRDRRRELAERVVEPVIVAWDGTVPPITGQCTLTLESGESWNLKSLRQAVPTGYHRLKVEEAGRLHDVLVISAPTKAHFPFDHKTWGVFAPIYALHSKQSPNAGDLADFSRLIDLVTSHGGRVAATLPLLAAFLDKPFEPSPYSPASRLFWNEFYADVDASSKPRRADLVDYRKEMAFRRSVLEKEADAFFSRQTRDDRFEAFSKKSPELDLYARFRAVTEKLGHGWTQWPKQLQDSIETAELDERVKRYHLYAQWKVHEQLQTMADRTRRAGELLYLDLPLGLHIDSFDIWRYRDQFALDASGGAPPDLVFTTGQNWSFPPMHPERMRFHHHDYTIAYIRNHLRFARMLRIDHVMGLHRLFWIPAGLTGDKGVYVEYPAEELYAILSLESHRYEAGIVGENLGLVPAEVTRSMRRHNIHQMFVVQYELAADNPKRAMRPIPRDSVASLNTHDVVPFHGFLNGDDIDDRLNLKFIDRRTAAQERKQRRRVTQNLVAFLRHKRLLKSGRVEPEELTRAILQFLSQSMAKVVLVNLEDLWKETRPQNIPATQKERPNWRRRMKLSIEEIERSMAVKTVLDVVNNSRNQ